MPASCTPSEYCFHSDSVAPGGQESWTACQGPPPTGHQLLSAADKRSRDAPCKMAVHALFPDLLHEQNHGERSPDSCAALAVTSIRALSKYLKTKAFTHQSVLLRFSARAAAALICCAMLTCFACMPQEKSLHRRVGLKLVTTSLQCCGPIPEPPQTPVQAIEQADCMAISASIAAQQQEEVAAGSEDSSAAMEVSFLPCHLSCPVLISTNAAGTS